MRPTWRHGAWCSHASPPYKLYDSGVHFLEDCAAVLAMYPHGATVRHGHRRVLYTQGVDGNAGDSYDAVARLALARIAEQQETR